MNEEILASLHAAFPPPSRRLTFYEVQAWADKHQARIGFYCTSKKKGSVYDVTFLDGYTLTIVSKEDRLETSLKSPTTSEGKCGALDDY